MASRAVQQGLKQVKPILSSNRQESRRRVLNLYRAWYRQVPSIVKEYDIPVTVAEGREKVRELFLKNRHVTDIRAVDMLVIKGQMELVEAVEIWKQKNHIMNYFKDTQEPRPTDFLSKFYDGHE